MNYIAVITLALSSSVLASLVTTLLTFWLQRDHRKAEIARIEIEIKKLSVESRAIELQNYEQYSQERMSISLKARRADEKLKQIAERAKVAGTQVEKEDMGGKVTDVQVRKDRVHDYRFLIGKTSIWYMEEVTRRRRGGAQDIHTDIWRLDYDAQLVEVLQELNKVVES